MTTGVADELAAAVRGTVRALEELSDVCGLEVEAATAAVVDAFRGGGRLLIAGNGGSAADALHMATELTSSFRVGLRRRALPAIPLSGNVAAITACANDFSFDDVFARQVEAYGRAGDVLLAISTSGSSVNVLRAAEVARAAGIRVIGLTRAGRTTLAPLCDVVIGVPATDTQVIQTLHLLIEHTICAGVEEAFLLSDDSPTG